VTFVTQVTNSRGNVESSYTAGYLGAFVMGAAVGAIVTSGTGYYYPPYMAIPWGGYPVYRPYPHSYGAYGSTAYYPHRNRRIWRFTNCIWSLRFGDSYCVLQSLYWNSVTNRFRFDTPYGKRSVGQAYNPYTGTYGATHQGSSPTAQWGQSYVSNGNRSATYSALHDFRKGLAAFCADCVGRKGRRHGVPLTETRAAAKTSNGDMYAGHDGNVYKNTGSGWEKSNAAVAGAA